MSRDGVRPADPPSSVAYAYISGAGHSGSTLLDLLISSHSRCVSLGEITYLPKNVALNIDCMCGAKVPRCPLWSPVLDRLGAILGGDFHKRPYDLDLGYLDSRIVVDRAHQTRLYELERGFVHGLQYLDLRFGIPFFRPLLSGIDASLKRNLLLYDVVRELTGTGIAVDSSKTYLKGLGIYRERPDRVRILHLVRDGRAVFYSGIKRKMPWGESLAAWQNHYARALPLLARHVAPEHVLHLKYEDLAREPRRELARVCEFLGLEFEESMLDFDSKQHHLINGNAMKYSAGAIRLDREWEERLSARELDFFERRAGGLNRALGYS